MAKLFIWLLIIWTIIGIIVAIIGEQWLLLIVSFIGLGVFFVLLYLLDQVGEAKEKMGKVHQNHEEQTIDVQDIVNDRITGNAYRVVEKIDEDTVLIEDIEGMVHKKDLSELELSKKHE